MTRRPPASRRGQRTAARAGQAVITAALAIEAAAAWPLLPPAPREASQPRAARRARAEGRHG
ncbi:MAG TPA: hypothetical protein VH478_07585 [Trebonia sp.]|nr:hypothetical protein [Trebonia sp.]